jgi:hypothetical protein
MTDDKNGKPGTKEWWAHCGEFKSALGQAVHLIDKIRSTDWLFLQDEGHERCIKMLDEAAAAIQKAKDARHRLAELGVEEVAA